MSIDRLIAAGLLICVAAVAAAAQLRIPSSILPAPPPSCSVVAMPSSTGEIADTIQPATLARRTIYLRSTSAGAWLRVRGQSDDTGVYRVTIRTKLSGETRMASVICADIRWSPSQGALIASDARHGPGSIWQVEMSVAAGAGGKQVELVREPKSGSNGAEADGDIAALFALSCDDWSPDRDTVHRAGGFSNRVRLEVDPPPVDRSLDAARRADLSRLVLSAAALWVRACRECRPENLAVIVVDGHVFIRPGVQQWLESLDMRSLVAAPAAAETALRDHLENTVHLGTTPLDARIKSLEPYVPVDGLIPIVTTLCTASPTSAWGETLLSVRNALCAPDSLSRDRRARIEVRLRPSGVTYCGNDAEIIACRADNVLTELNTKSFRFRVRPGSEVGSGAVSIDLLPVLVHEMGHWIGLRHIDRGTSIMASTADRARCIDEGTVAALNADLGASNAAPQAFRLHADPREGRRRPAPRPRDRSRHRAGRR